MSPFFSTFLVAALGYFVDVYDLVLFGVVRIESLKAIGVPEERLLSDGMWLMDCQMIGMLVGGLFWGYLADRKGRTTVMMASILLYSLANLANAFVGSVSVYAMLRFLAGLGLAGEVGAAVTLISESSQQTNRTLWTTLLTCFGLMGAVAAGIVGDWLHWKAAYLLGGGMGLGLLVLRLRVAESSLFTDSNASRLARPDFLFRTRQRFVRFVSCVLLGVPIWYVVGILVSFSPEIMKERGLLEPISTGRAILLCYVGFCLGDLVTGMVSHLLRNRKKVIAGALLGLAMMVSIYLSASIETLRSFEVLCVVLGFFGGYWAVYITTVSENFGTNLRGAAVIMTTNGMRGAVVLMTLGVQFLRQYGSLVQSTAILGGIVIGAAFLALLALPETFGKDLNYLEGA
ncbi:MAG: MFS transporter [Myxococcaceae bacterium]|nr:MFS transporter [Myxococcaceae bacterium]MBH2006852.1 MFS transporter [Myxococcaceae bacterium]